MPLNIGDAVLSFLGDTTQLDQVFARIPAEAEASMTAAAGSVGQVGVAAQAVSFELDATATNAAYAGGMVEESMGRGGESTRGMVEQLKVGEEMFGIHLPRGVNRFLAELPGLQTAISAAFAAGVVFFLIEAMAKGVEKIIELAGETDKINKAWTEFGTAVQQSFNGLDDKLLEAGIKVDNLRGDHLAALRKELELIDHQSMKELEGEFGLLAKAADAMFTQLKAHWFEIGTGSTGAAHAFDEFKTKYDFLLAAHKDKDASDLLSGTLQSAKESLATMEAAKKAAQEANTIEEQGGGPSEKELKAQHALIDALDAQIRAQGTINELSKDNSFIKTAEERKRATEEAQKAAEKEFKLLKELAQARDDLNKQVEKGADDASKYITRLGLLEMKEEEKRADEKLLLLKRQNEGQIAAIDGEMKLTEDATQHDAELLKIRYDRREITAKQYLIDLKQLYEKEVQDLTQMLDRKEQLVIREAQIEAAQRGKILTDADAKELKSYVDLESKKTAIQNEFATKYLKAEDQVTAKIIKEHATLSKLLDDYTKKLRGAERDLQGFGKVADAVLGDISNAFGSAIQQWLSGQESFGRALEKALAQYLVQVAGKAAVDALYFAAWGIADSFWNPARAGADFAAAEMFATIAAVAGAAGFGMGKAAGSGSSGGGASNGPAMTTGSSATQPATNPGQGRNVPHLASGGLISQPTLAMLGENSAREAVIPLSDGNAMNAIAEAISKQMHTDTGAGQTNFYIKGMVSSDQVGKLAKKLTRQVQTGRTRLTASNTHKITRRA